MNRPFLSFAAALAFAALGPAGQAFGQVGGLGGDPFSLYYGYYLPHAQAIAAQPSPLDSINQMTARRQVNAQTDRAALFDPISPYGSDDEGDGVGGRRGSGGARLSRQPIFDQSGNPANSNARGHGPTMYFNRTAQYHGTLRIGRGPNRNIATIRGGRGGMGGGGFGGGGSRGAPSAGGTGIR